MKGDFSRSTFDRRKHYTSVRMQQGRVQVDADWNEQADILLHLIATQLQDLLGPGGTTVTKPGFKITLDEPEEEITPVESEEKSADQGQAGQPEESTAPAPGVAITPDKSEEKSADQGQAGQPDEPTAPAGTLPDFWIGAGRYYVDGILCENEAKVQFSRQPDYPAAASLLQKLSDHDDFLIYLDVWQRHITAAEDPAIREVALGGPDTTTRIQTVWQVKLLPLSDHPADDQDWRDHGGLRSLPDWQEFVAPASQKGLLNARWDQSKGSVPENCLHRVEIHTVAEDQATFKWSRENGSVVFPITDVSQDSGEGTLCLTVEGLERDPYQLAEGSWVELVDDVTVLNGRPLPLCQVRTVDRPNSRVTLWAVKETMDQVFAEIHARKLRHPLLRRWEAEKKAIASEWLDLRVDDKAIASERPDPKDGTKSIAYEWSDSRDDKIQIAFSDTGTYQAGDYWLIPARTGSETGIEWPQEDGQPKPQAPHGIVHHYAPLALLQFGEGDWQVIPDDAATFATLPQVDARLARVDVHLDEHVDLMARLGGRVTVLEERQADCQAPLVQYFQIADEIEIGHVVSVIPADPSDEPDSELRVRLANSENERDRRLVVGVVKDILKDGESCRVVLYGRAQCKVIGRVKPGDLLVPSPVPGHARKAGLYLRPGTILGKALGSTKLDAEVMEELDEGTRPDKIDMSKPTGTVDMMVTLG